VNRPPNPGCFGQACIKTGVGDQIVKPGIKAKGHSVRVVPFHRGGVSGIYLDNTVLKHSTKGFGWSWKPELKVVGSYTLDALRRMLEYLLYGLIR
jgi:hypothetical protein